MVAVEQWNHGIDVVQEQLNTPEAFIAELTIADTTSKPEDVERRIAEVQESFRSKMKKIELKETSGSLLYPSIVWQGFALHNNKMNIYMYLYIDIIYSNHNHHSKCMFSLHISVKIHQPNHFGHIQSFSNKVYLTSF